VARSGKQEVAPSAWGREPSSDTRDVRSLLRRGRKARGPAIATRTGPERSFENPLKLSQELVRLRSSSLAFPVHLFALIFLYDRGESL
jgi:hypothetical protein